MGPSRGHHDQLLQQAAIPQRNRAPTITIHPAEGVVPRGQALQSPTVNTQDACPTTSDPQDHTLSLAFPSYSRPHNQAFLEIPNVEVADAVHEGSNASPMSPVFSAMTSHPASSCSTFLEYHHRPGARRLSHLSMSDCPFSFSPKALAETIASKSIAELEALGGLDGLARGLQTDLRAGLGSENGQSAEFVDLSLEGNGHGLLKSRIDIYGINRVPVKKAKGILELMMIALISDKVLVLLCIVATISLFLGLYQNWFQPHLPGQSRIEWVDSLAIMAAVLIVVVTGAVNDHQKEKQFARLVNKTEDRTVKAMRSGKVTEISAFDILVGDVLQISAGNLIPADGVLVTGYSVRCDESSITGESDHVTKVPLHTALSRLSVGEVANDLDPFMISGSKVLEGTGTYLVTGVGVNSIYGRLKMDVTERTETTPLQKKLSDIADKIAMAGLTVSVLLLGVLTIKLLVRLSGSGTSVVEFVQIFLRIFMVSISIIVVAVPEGLPLAVTLALAIGVTRMLKDNNLVRVLSACETMGNATVVCSDKTGTLTMNKMTVTAGCIGLNGTFNYLEANATPGSRREPHDSRRGTVSPASFRSSIEPQVQDILVRSIAINSTALEGQADGLPTFMGPSTETALLTFSRKWLGMRPLQEERANSQIVQMYPFDSARKYMATVTIIHNGLYRVYIKGAPEVILRKCSRVLYDATMPLAEDTTLTQDHHQSLIQVLDGYGKLSLRTIGFAYKDIASWPPEEASTADEMLQHILGNMTFLGILAMQDPLRPEVRNAIAECAQAGVSVRMVTGDNVQTATAIAKECGILTSSGVVIEGPEFRKLSASEMYDLLPRLQVLARSSPEDKKLLVKRFKELGETIAVTGDGTNDGPALRTADVGFSMGISGTDVAKEASSIVLMDDNFSSIVSAIKWGRSINDAIKKFLNFQLTVNITAVTLTFVSAVTSDTGESMLSAAQLLWVNLIMDTLAALALATDPANPSVLQRAPDTKKTPLISITGWKMIVGQAMYQLVVIFILNLKGASLLRPMQSDEETTLETFMFNTFVWMQLFNLYNNRRLDNKFNIFEDLHKNLYFIAINIVIITGQVLIVTIGGNALSTTPLSPKEWMISIILGAFCIPVAVLIRLIPDGAIRAVLGQGAPRQNSGGISSSNSPNRVTWLSTVDHVRCELGTISQPRDSRVRRILMKFWCLLQRWDSAEGPERRNIAHERTPLLQRHDGGAVCAPSVVMVGMIAGGVGGWPRVERDE
ncbi:Calcium transporting P-type ATPase [Trichoderma cornu-damae]|uniref:Calcium-transporting ATPase n=1 Tax=Trichoderma cornu-damae TaxID=654480 RepID=A0A9P8TTP8_9HYPO|nr:Calcium transporting P-type ATPase [Trichoderma cornu-damae]